MKMHRPGISNSYDYKQDDKNTAVFRLYNRESNKPRPAGCRNGNETETTAKRISNDEVTKYEDTVFSSQ
jgi:hypothetical protein